MSAIYINGEPVVQSSFPEMTLAQYNALPETEKPEFWIRTDASYDSIPGTAVTFDNDGTTIESTDVDGAIKEVDANRKEDLTSIFESGTTASQAISARTFFYLNGILVRAKTAIASGATFTLNTNYEEVTIGGSISSIAQDGLKFGWFYTEIGGTVAGGVYTLDVTSWLASHGGIAVRGFAFGTVYGNDASCWGTVVRTSDTSLGYKAENGNSMVTVIMGVLFYI